MTPTLTPKNATLGATITDIDLASLDDASWRFVEDAFIEYGVLIFPENLTTLDCLTKSSAARTRVMWLMP